MANPITWRNVGATVDTSGIGGLMEGASDSMNKATKGVDAILKARKDREAANWDQGKTNNTNAYMNKLNSAATPEELAAMKERGEFQAMMQQYGAQIDQGAARTALDGRNAILQDRKTAGIEYDNSLTMEENKAARAALYEAASSGKKAEYDRLYGATEWANPDAVQQKGSGIFAGLREEAQANRKIDISAGHLNVSQEQLAMDQELQRRQMTALDRQEQERLDKEAVAQVGVNIHKDWDEYRTGAANEANEIAIGLGAEVDENGQAVIDPDDLELNAAIQEQLSGQEVLTQSEFMHDRMESRLAERLNRQPTTPEVVAAMESAEHRGEVASTLASTDRKRYKEQTESIDRSYSKKGDEMDRRHQEALSGNIFAEGQDLTSERINSAYSVLDQLDGGSLIFNNNTKAGLTAKIQDITMGGIEVRGKNRKVPAPLMNAVIRQVSNDWGSQSGNLEDRIRQVIDRNFDQYVNAETMLESQIQERTELDLDKLRTLSSLEAQVQEETGTANDPTGELAEFVGNNVERLRREDEAQAIAEEEARARAAAGETAPVSTRRAAEKLTVPTR